MDRRDWSSLSLVLNYARTVTTDTFGGVHSSAPKVSVRLRVLVSSSLDFSVTTDTFGGSLS